MSSLSGKSESELIIQLKKGSEDAFGALYEMYARRLYAFCLEYCHSREDTEEIVQDAFIWLWKNKENLRKETSIKSILFIRAKHFLINAWRARLNSPMFEDYLDYVNQIQDESGNQLEYDEFKTKVLSIIDQLPRTQAKVVKMSKLEGFRNKEIAQKLRLSEQTVKNALSVGLKFLKEKLGAFELLVLFMFIVCL